MAAFEKSTAGKYSPGNLEEGPGGGKKVEELDKRESVGAARRRRKGVPEAPAARHVIVESISPRR